LGEDEWHRFLHTAILFLFLLLLLPKAKEKNMGKDFERKKINRAKCADELTCLYKISTKTTNTHTHTHTHNIPVA